MVEKNTESLELTLSNLYNESKPLMTQMEAILKKYHVTEGFKWKLIFGKTIGAFDDTKINLI
jgi:hypothetical protein